MPDEDKKTFFEAFGDKYDEVMELEWGREIDTWMEGNKNKYTGEYQMGGVELLFSIFGGAKDMLKYAGVNTA